MLQETALQGLDWLSINYLMLMITSEACRCSKALLRVPISLPSGIESSSQKATSRWSNVYFPLEKIGRFGLPRAHHQPFSLLQRRPYSSFPHRKVRCNLKRQVVWACLPSPRSIPGLSFQLTFWSLSIWDLREWSLRLAHYTHSAAFLLC